MSSHFCPFCRQTNDPARTDCAACGGLRPETGWPRDPLVGRIFASKYRSESRLGAGGFGTVLLATQIHGDQDLGHVVLKILHADLAHNEEILRRFVNEARAARQLGSPHAVKVFDLAYDEEGVPFIVMEYLEGTSLADVLAEEKRLPLGRTLTIARQVADALVECHEKGIVHRDLKPDNILLLGGRHEDFVKILDFGIAKVPSPTGPVTNTLMGTPLYMPPEQLLQQPIDHRVDVFALGVILYECLTGHPPIEAQSYTEYVIKNVQEPPRPLRALWPEAPEALEALLARMMAKSPADRPADMAQVSAALAEVAALIPGAQPREPARAREPQASPVAPTADAADPIDVFPEELFRAARRRRTALIAGVATLTVAAVAAVVWWQAMAPEGKGEATSKGPVPPAADPLDPGLRAGARPTTPRPGDGDGKGEARVVVRALGADAGPRRDLPRSSPGRPRVLVPGIAARPRPATGPRDAPPSRPARPEPPRPADDPFGRVR